ncbi:hypothetical protein BH23VER1_BH23VER1_10060 [soil metagenome]
MRMRSVLVTVFLATLVPAGAQVLITPTSLTNTSGVTEFFPAANIINDSGLSAPATILTYQTVTHAAASDTTAWTTNNPNGAGDYFLESNPGTPAIFTLTLDATYVLTDLVFWGYHFGSPNGNEARAFDVAFSSDGGATFPTSTSVSQPLSTYAAADAVTLAFVGSFQADTVRIDITDNHFGGDAPGGDRIGLGELKFVGTVIPEPAAALLGALGLCGLLLRRSRI